MNNTAPHYSTVDYYSTVNDVRGFVVFRPTTGKSMNLYGEEEPLMTANNTGTTEFDNKLQAENAMRHSKRICSCTQILRRVEKNDIVIYYYL